MTDTLCNNFKEFLKQGEANKVKKVKIWEMAIGLQQIDDKLIPSNYLIETAKKNIKGDISIEEVKKRIDNYYEKIPIKDKKNKEEEADKVSTRIVELLNEQTFVFSPEEYLNIHRRLFQDIYPNAGKIQDYKITKKEWVLSDKTVLYKNAYKSKDKLEYDFEQEKKFSYSDLSQSEIIEHIADFISYLWKIHIFREGNAITIAVFLIKYLHKLGFKNMNKDLFEKHSWYFRNAIIRANHENLSKSIQPTKKYLINFLSNLLLGKNHILKNREMHIYYNDTVKIENDTIFNMIKENNKITISEIAEKLNISLSTAKKRIQTLKDSRKIERVGSDKTGYWKVL